MKKSFIGWFILICVAAFLFMPAAFAEQKPETKNIILTKLDGTKIEKQAETPRYGGVFIQGTPKEPQNFDEAFGSPEISGSTLLTNEELLGGDWTRGPSGTGEVSWLHFLFPAPTVQTGCLATAWELLDPGTLVFHVRKGVRFHDKPPTNGRELEAEDVVFSLKRLWENPKSYHYSGLPWKDHFESITAPDKWTVVIKSPPGKMGRVFETCGDLVRIVPRDAVSAHGDLTDWRNAVGTGPFILKEYISGNYMEFVRNPNYWRKDPLLPENQLPYLDGVRWVFISDLSTRIAALRAAKIDWIGGRSGVLGWDDAKPLIESQPQLKYKEYHFGVCSAIAFRVDKPELPIHDIRVRRALNMAVDKRTIRDTYYSGRAEFMCGQLAPIPEFADMVVPVKDLPPSSRELYEYNPEKAKQLLADAGYPNGFKTEVACLSSGVDLLSIVKDYWSKVGVDLTLDVKEGGVFVSIYGAKTHKEMIMWSITGTIPFRFLPVRPKNLYNVSMINDPYINQKIDEIDASHFQEAVRRKLFKELNLHLIDQCFYMDFPGANVFLFWWPWVKGYNGEHMVGYSNFEDFQSYIWLDKDLKKEMAK